MLRRRIRRRRTPHQSSAVVLHKQGADLSLARQIKLYAVELFIAFAIIRALCRRLYVMTSWCLVDLKTQILCSRSCFWFGYLRNTNDFVVGVTV